MATKETSNPSASLSGDASTPPWLLVGLGNPGSEYLKTRHNIGFDLVDAIAGPCAAWKNHDNGLVTRVMVAGRSLVLLKPQSYMNLSGGPTSSVLNYFKVPLEHLLVAQDDIDLPLGKVRVRGGGGGDGGHRGIRSIAGVCGKDFIRIKLGVGRPPPEWSRVGSTDGQGDDAVARWVLQRFSRDEGKIVDEIIAKSREAVAAIMTDGLTAAANRYNG